MSAEGGLFSGGTLTAIFATAAIDILLFAWMHFTPDGLLFGSFVAEKLGMVNGVTEAAGLGAVQAVGGEEALVFN